MSFILASASPRRRELLRLAGVTNFSVCPAEVNEDLPAGLPPDEAVILLSRRKTAAAAAVHSPDDVILAADTLVFLDGAPLTKPSDDDDAFRMLSSLSGRSHQVFTGYTIFHRSVFHSRAERTDVYFRSLEEAEIRDYIASGESSDKAGAYGIQGRASVFISRIEGDYYNVMGLPVCSLYTMLHSLGLEQKF